MTSLLLFAACSSRPGLAAWAFDPIVLQPEGLSDVTGFQTWEVYDDRWNGESKAGKHFVCAVVVSFSGSASTSCPECTESWDVQTELLESDCPDSWLRLETFPDSLRAVGIGSLSVDEDAPWPQSTWVGWIDEGYGWTEHGWAWPTLLDDGGTQVRDGWNGDDSFSLWPTSAWQLTP